ncbi:MAG: geranylgeranylglyceryl/heptaprenylglyceryl phosphate synthase [Bacteroidota bacterium]
MNQNSTLFQKISAQKNAIAVLIDPEKQQDEAKLIQFIKKASIAKIDYFFVGGSTVTRQELEFTIQILKKTTSTPLVIFPGSYQQISENADAILYLSLLSGRNPDYLIGHHVQSAQELFSMDLEVISTAYLLIDGGTKSSVAYVSQTTPIPQNQKTIVKNTAMAAKMLGKQLIYLDAGSGALNTVPLEMIREIRDIGLPIIIGGGIRAAQTIKDMHDAGANIVVIGNKLEEDDNFFLEIVGMKQNTQN